MPLFQESSGGGGSSRTLVTEFVATGGETEVVISGLDMVADGGVYEVEVDFDYNSYSNAAGNIYLNGQTSGAYGSYFKYTATVTTSVNVSNLSNNNFPTFQLGHQGTKMTINFSLSAIGKVFFTYETNTVTGDGTVRKESYACSHLGTNVTAIRFTPWLGLNAGSYVRVYKPA